MEKYIYIIVIVSFVVIVPIVLYFILKPMFAHNKTLNGVVNHDAFMRKFIFRIELTKEEFYAQLKMRNFNDTLEYNLNDDYTIIVFIKYNKKFQYKIMIDEFNEYVILKVEQIPKVSKVTYCINEFFIKKFNAIPLNFEKYSF